MPGEVTHTFCTECYGPFVTLPGLGDYSFPLTLIMGIVILGGTLRALLHDKYILHVLHCGVVAQFPLDSLGQIFMRTLQLHLLACLLSVTRAPTDQVNF